MQILDTINNNIIQNVVLLSLKSSKDSHAISITFF